MRGKNRSSMNLYLDFRVKMRKILQENQKLIMDKLDNVLNEKKDLIISSFQDWRESVNDVIHRLENVTLKEMVISTFMELHYCQARVQVQGLSQISKETCTWSL